MLGRTDKQRSFWDSEWIEHLIDEESFEWHFKRVVRPLISDDDFAWAYDKERGREAIPPSLVACALILQQRYRLSDREMERQIRFNLATKYALGLPMDDKGFDHTVLCKFRGMLVESGETKLCFDKFREALIRAGLIKAGEAAVIDTTHVIADIAIPNTIELIRMGMERVLRAAECLPVGRRQIEKNLDLKILNDLPKRGGDKERLVELVYSAKRLVSYLDKSGDGSHPSVKGELIQLKRILYENIEERDEGSGKGKREVIEEREGPVPDRLVSVVDPDARHGRKSEEKKFVGYKAQVIESEQEFITAIDGMLGNRHDTFGVQRLVREAAFADIKPKSLTGDKAYGGEPLGIALEGMGVKMVTPLDDKARERHFTNDEFIYINEQGQAPRLRCPAGKETDIRVPHLCNEVTFHFSNCGACSLRPKCTTAENRTVTISPSYFYRQRKAIFNQTLLYGRLMKERSKIERKNGQLKNRFGFRRCWYRGLAKFRFQCFFAALAANIQRLITIVINAPPRQATAMAFA